MKSALSVLLLCFLLASCGEEKTVKAETTYEEPNWPRAEEWPRFASYEWGATEDEMLEAFAKEGFKWVDNQEGAYGKLLGEDAWITPGFSPSGNLERISVNVLVDRERKGMFFDKVHNLLKEKYGNSPKEPDNLVKGAFYCQWLCPAEIEGSEVVLGLNNRSGSLKIFYHSKEYVKAGIATRSARKKQREEQRNQAKEREKRAKERAKEQEKDF